MDDAGSAQEQLWKYPVAFESLFREALRRSRSADETDDLSVSLAYVLIHQHRFAEARTMVAAALAHNPYHRHARWRYAQLAFFMNDPWPDVWRTMEARWDLNITGGYPLAGMEQKRWDGSPLARRSVLLAGEGAFGDQIQFARLAGALKRAGAGRVTVSASAPLLPLLRDADGVDAVVEMEWDTNRPPAGLHYDVAVPLLSAPLLLRLTGPGPDTIPYIRCRSVASRSAQTLLATGRGCLNVGLSWRSRSPYRSVPLPMFEPLSAVEGVRLFALGGRLDRGEHAGVPIVDFGRTSIGEEAAIMGGLDLIVSVDTMSAHLAGSLGRPVWVLLPYVPDCLWGADGTGTPWYPSMRLFRQDADRTWSVVIDRVAAELRQLAR